jgi:SAM-dependent methyltransferase
MNAYDETPYPDLSYVHTHPDRLATLATLLGLAPTPVTTCRLLEIGCAAGGNLLPMAYGLPAAEFVGVDLSARQIADGQQRIAHLGLHNVTLLCRDLAGLGEEMGSFDYIVAHGIYSWVPEPVRDRLMAVCKQLLRPHGIVYISYNTYPGWHIRGVIRDAMLFHTRTETEPQAKAQAARSIAHFIADHVVKGNTAYGGIFQGYLESLDKGLRGSNDSFLLHDELEECNDPVYFYQFVEHAARHGLQYLVEAELRDVLPHIFQPETRAQLQSLASDAVTLEQYMDFLRNRMFRLTLLCHADVPVQRTLRPEPVFRLLARSQAQPARAEEPGAPTGLAQFRSLDNATLTTDHPVSAAAFTQLAAVWPRALPFVDLLAAGQAAMQNPQPPRPAGAPPDEVLLAANLLRAYGYSTQLVNLHTVQPSMVTGVSESPVASPVARLEAMGRNMVTNVWHERVTLEPIQCHLAVRLDVSRSRDDLLAELRPVAETLAGQAELTAEALERHLQQLADAALLVG